MLLTIDAGNTNVVIGVFNGNELIGTWRVSSSSCRTSDEAGIVISGILSKFSIKDIDACVMASVTPEITPLLCDGIRRYFGVTPILINYKMKLNISISGSDKNVPAEVGADRIAVCAAAYDIFKEAVIVIDYGTATTYDVVSKEGVFLTGITAPGIGISAAALFEKAALLNDVEITLPETIIAVDSITSIQCGIAFSAIGETEYIVRRLKKELNMDCKVIATGGFSHLISKGTEMIDYHDADLLLKGLRFLYELNKV